MNKTGISYCTHTLNPLSGCARVSDGCKHCWAEEMTGRLTAMGRDDLEAVVQITEAGARWTRVAGERLGQLARLVSRRSPARVFICDMTDLWWSAHRPDARLAVIGAILARHEAVEVLTLTKRVTEAAAWADAWLSLPDPVGRAWDALMAVEDGGVRTAASRPGVRERATARAAAVKRGRLPWSFGVTVESETTAAQRLPMLRHLRADMVWISAEPLITAWNVNLWAGAFDTLVLGGESGPMATVRPCDVVGLTRMAVDAAACGVAVHVKQLGRRPLDGTTPIRLRHSHGVDPEEWPAWVPHLREWAAPDDMALL